MITEPAPYGVIGSITPSTNPSETVINNGIGMLAAGNAAVEPVSFFVRIEVPIDHALGHVVDPEEGVGGPGHPGHR